MNFPDVLPIPAPSIVQLEIVETTDVEEAVGIVPGVIYVPFRLANVSISPSATI